LSQAGRPVSFLALALARLQVVAVVAKT